MIERSHLKIILALQQSGSLTQAAEALCLTQSALSHQIRNLEHRLGVRLWRRQGRQLRLTSAGEYLLVAAQQVLPVLDKTEHMIRASETGKRGSLRVGVECYPCYQWLTGIVARFMQQIPDVEIDIIDQFQFEGLAALRNHHVDLLITPDPIKSRELVFEALMDYELVLVVSSQHALANVKQLTANMIADEILLTFPVARERLDVFTQFLSPAAVTPKFHKQMESVEIMLQTVSMQRGVCLLPDWLVEHYRKQFDVKTLTVGRRGIQKTLYAALRKQDAKLAYIDEFIELSKRTDV